MKHLYLLWALLAWAGVARAQTSSPGESEGGPALEPSRWTPHVDSLFEHLDRSPVGTGLLANYGVALHDLSRYQGTALDSGNCPVSLLQWRLLYGALQSSRYTSAATLPLLSTANSRLAQAIVRQQAGQALDLAVLLARYERFRDDAGTAGLLTISNKQFYDTPGRSRSPYEQRTLLAVCPVVGRVATRTPQLRLASVLRFTNAAPTVALLELDAGDGQGYRAAAWNQALPASYPANGTYTLRCRFTCTDGTVLLAHARLEVQAPELNPAARYGLDGSPGVTTFASTALFTDTRAYASGGYFPITRAATGKVTVAYAASNTTGTIRKPLIVVEGYDPSAALNRNGPQLQGDYAYNDFIQYKVLGGINVSYQLTDAGDKPDFNEQFSEVGQYDLIFLNLTNGTDYIQRNAYLLERLIQWVNDNKQPLPGQSQKEPNVVLGMSTGGLIARYALRDMEIQYNTPNGLVSGAYQNPRWLHDTRLYVSHEAPHQGANVPLGFQYLVKSVAGIRITGLLTASQLAPEIQSYVNLLNEPATQQLLLYQTDPAGTNLHTAWLNEYQGMGYPQNCRNVATSGGSECGQNQSLLPGDLLVSIQGTGLLSDYNLSLNIGLFLEHSLGGSILATLAALGTNEGRVDFTVHALPDRQQQRIYHGRFTICKEIIHNLYTTCLLDFEDGNDSYAWMLPYDSAPGGTYSVRQFAGSKIVSNITAALPLPLNQVYIRPEFCFVPTTSALDVGGGQVALSTSDLTASYVNTAPPVAPRNSPFSSFVTAGRENLSHILWTGLNSKWVYRQLQNAGQNQDCLAYCQASMNIIGPSTICAGGSATYSIGGLPAGTDVVWVVNNGSTVLSPVYFNGPAFTLTADANAANKVGEIKATITHPCGPQITSRKSVFVGAPEAPELEGPTNPDCTNYSADYYITNYDPLLTYTIQLGGVFTSKKFFTLTGRIEVLFSGPGQGTLKVSVGNGCTATPLSSTLTAQVGACGPATTYAVYPNPASDEVTVAEGDPAQRGAAAGTPGSSATGSGGHFTVRVYDGYGTLRHTGSTRTGQLQVPTRPLPVGLYLLTITEGEDGPVVRRQLEVAR